jgi:hypothetical protein
MASRDPLDASVSLPVAPVDRWLAPLSRFLHIEAASGIVLLSCTAVALTLANSPLAAWFASVWKTPVSLSLGGLTVSGDIGHLIVNDGLMTLFFFVVGLELKRELVHGELRDPRKALLPVFAALGGVLMPAAIYLALQWGDLSRCLRSTLGEHDPRAAIRPDDGRRGIRRCPARDTACSPVARGDSPSRPEQPTEPTVICTSMMGVAARSALTGHARIVGQEFEMRTGRSREGSAPGPTRPSPVDALKSFSASATTAGRFLFRPSHRDEAERHT